MFVFAKLKLFFVLLWFVRYTIQHVRCLTLRRQSVSQTVVIEPPACLTAQERDNLVKRNVWFQSWLILLLLFSHTVTVWLLRTCPLVHETFIDLSLSLQKLSEEHTTVTFVKVDVDNFVGGSSFAFKSSHLLLINKGHRAEIKDDEKKYR